MPVREIEVKAKVRNRQVLIEKLAKLSCRLSDENIQIDRIFVPIGTKIPAGKGTNILRLRKEKDKLLFTLKQVNENQLDKIEKEFYVSDEEQAIETFQLLGFEESVSVEKKRSKCRYQEYEICLDEVTGLGLYIEVEKKTDLDTVAVQNELFMFLQSLGINNTDREYVGYDILLLEKQIKSQ